ncbi:MAG: carbon-nitrogen hydrolase family protein [Panacagrimonas sp.]
MNLPVKNCVAAIQMCAGDDVPANLAGAARLLEQAAAEGAVLAALPENFAFMGARDTDKLAHAEASGAGPIQEFLAQQSLRLGMWIVAGTVPLAVEDDPGRVSASCLVYDTSGACAARYDKIHLFDVDVSRQGKSERYRESSSIAPGPWKPVCVDTPAGRLGLSVCYDLRFPELYRELVGQGAELLCVPAAFTTRTGAAHWEVLLRARAVENQCFVIAPGQHGTHPGGRGTFGHSMIVDPWGDFLDFALEGDAAVVAEVDRERQRELRASFPVLTHRRSL